MAKRKKKRKGGKKKGGHIPLGILEKRLVSLGKVVEKRGSDFHVAKD